MKRISLMLALFLTLSFGMAFAQEQGGDIYLNSVEGLFGGDIPLNVGEVVFHFNYRNLDPVYKVKGCTNGYELSVTDSGATWVGGFGREFAFTASNHFNLVNKIKKWSWDGIGWDTVSYAGAIGDCDPEDDPPPPPDCGLGIPPLYDDSAVYISVNFDPVEAMAGEVFCIDSCYFPPAGTWKWAYGDPPGGPGSFFPSWDGPHCWTLAWIPNQPPIWDPLNPVTAGGDHCDLVCVSLTAWDPDPPPNGPDPITFTNTGIGTMTVTDDGADGYGTIQICYQPTLADVSASLSLTATVSDPINNPVACVPVSLNFTNQDPIFTGGLGTTTPIGMGNSGTSPVVSTDDVDCDPSTVTIDSWDPAIDPASSFVLNDLGDGDYSVTFNSTAPGDGGQLFTVTLKIDDLEGAVRGSTTGTLMFDVLLTEPFEVQIAKTHNTLQGMHVIVDVTLNKGSENMGGWDFLIAYDASALNFRAAIPGDMHTICGWEYFNYRYGPFGNCGNQCPSGLLRVVAIAETNNGANHPGCLQLNPKPIVLFKLDFLVSNDRTLECMYVPIRFFWMDCGDNSIAYHPVDDSLASIQGVSRYVIDFDLIGHIENMYTGFPTYTGVQASCFDTVWYQDAQHVWHMKPLPVQWVDFYNGGVDIVCADSIDDRGDINLNGTPNEIADAVLFSNYFVKGLIVFNVPGPNAPHGQIAATDVNADGLTLSVADLVYLIRIIVGDALPYPKLGAEAATFAYENGVMSVDTRMGAAFVVLEGDVAPRLLADNMEMNYAFDGRNTKVLIYKIEREAGFAGEFLAFDANIVSVEMATYDGAPVAAKNMPLSYKLHQNYPNPFNSQTTIAFGLPQAGDYSLTIYNITGQKVTSFAGSAEAGMVTLSWDAADQASGVYFYKLDTDNFTSTKKMVYLK